MDIEQQEAFEDELYDIMCQCMEGMQERKNDKDHEGFYLSTNLSEDVDLQTLFDAEKKAPWLRVRGGTHGAKYGLYVNPNLGDVANAWNLIRHLPDVEETKAKLVNRTFDNIVDKISVPFIGNIRGFDEPQKFFVNYGITAFMDVNDPFVVLVNNLDSPFMYPVVFKDAIDPRKVLPNNVEVPLSYVLNMVSDDFIIDVTNPYWKLISHTGVTWYCPYSGLPHPKAHQFDLALATLKACVETETRCKPNF